MYVCLFACCMGVEMTSGFDSQLINVLQFSGPWNKCTRQPSRTSIIANKNRFWQYQECCWRTSHFEPFTRISRCFVPTWLHSRHSYRALYQPEIWATLACVCWLSNHGDWVTPSGLCTRSYVYHPFDRDCFANSHSRDVSLRPYGSWVWHSILHYFRLLLDWRAWSPKGSRYLDISFQLFLFHWLNHSSGNRPQDHRNC
jgi:hypothetical protein